MTIAVVKLQTLFSVLRSMNMNTQISRRRLPSLGFFKKLKPSKKLLKTVILLVVVVGAVSLAAKYLGRLSNSQEDNGIAINDALAKQSIGKELGVPLLDSEGEEISSINFEIIDAEVRDEIIVRGQKATAVKGKVFLIISLKITNKHGQAVEMDTRDYIRLVVDGNEEELHAPDIHNDPVEIQAISTKNTRVGFPVDRNVSSLILRIGEVSGEKEDIDLDLDF